MRIGILQAGHLPPELIAGHGAYPALYTQLLAGQGFAFDSWDVVDMAFPASVHDADGWLISGSRHGAYEDLPFIARLMDFIRSAQSAKVPMVGICFGHQIMAQALGGRVEKFADGWSVGHQRYHIAGRELAAHAWHQDQVVIPPVDATHLGQSPFCHFAALRYGNHGLSFQPHPEFDGHFLQDLAQSRGPGYVPQAQLAHALATAHNPIDTSDFAHMIGDFYRKGAQP